jgi:hypothetical protein
MHSPGGEGDGGSIFWKTRDIGLPSYSNNLSTTGPQSGGTVLYLRRHAVQADVRTAHWPWAHSCTSSSGSRITVIWEGFKQILKSLYRNSSKLSNNGLC